MTLRIERAFPIGNNIGYLDIVANNFRKDAKDQKIIIPESTTDLDIINVWDELTRFSYDDDTILSALSVGVTAFGRDGSKIVPVNSKDERVDWNWNEPDE